MDRKKDLKNIQDQKDTFMACINRPDVYMDSDGVKRCLENYKLLVETENSILKTEEDIRKSKNDRSPLDWILKIGGFIVTAIGVIFIPQILADKAYDAEKDMSLKNGTIWNLIGKDFGPKKK